MTVIELLHNYNVKFSTEHHHNTPNWIQIQKCVFCGESNYHLGIHRGGTGAHCWKCGKHNSIETLSRLTKIPKKEVWKLLKANDINKELCVIAPKRKIKLTRNKLILPAHTKLKEHHKQYLINRNFDPDYLEKTYKLMSTGIIGAYRHRILIPAFINNNIVSFTTRDITGKAPKRYKTAHKSMELYPLKNLLYAENLIRGDNCIVVEGPADVWRLGNGAVATCGIEWTGFQLSALSKYKRVFILYDREPQQAVEQANKLAYNLDVLGIDNEIIDIKDVKDPGELSNEDAAYLMRYLKVR